MRRNDEGVLRERPDALFSTEWTEAPISSEETAGFSWPLKLGAACAYKIKVHVWFNVIEIIEADADATVRQALTLNDTSLRGWDDAVAIARRHGLCR